MSSTELDFTTLKTITKTIKGVTHSGCTSLEGTKYRYVLDCCKLSDGYVEHSFSKLILMLREKHSEVRLSAVLLCDALFKQFELFRNLLINSLDEFIFLTMPFKEDLPPPKRAASKLLELTVKTIHQWHDKYRCSQPKLAEKYESLRTKRNVDFEKMEIFDPVKRKKEAEEFERSLLVNKELLKKATQDVRCMENDINDCLTSLDTCFGLLVPLQKDCNNGELDIRTNGVFKNTSLEVDISFLKVQIFVTNENEAIIESIKENVVMINKRFLPKVKAWQVLIEKGEGSQNLKEEALEYSKRLGGMLDKYNGLEVIYSNDLDEVSTDSEMEEVDEVNEVKRKNHNEEELSFFEKIQRYKINLVENKQKIVKENKCDDSGSVTPKETKEEMSDRKKELLDKAPVMRYDVDLYSWGEEKKTETLLPSSFDGHRFWAVPDIDQVEVPLETRRVIEFTGKFEEVKHVCRAKLPSGQLCPRQDRIKCPFHGRIIPRDDNGIPLDGGESSKSIQQKVPEWQNPTLLARLKAETGIDLRIQKGRKVKSSPLTEIKKVPSVRDKLTKKVFNKGSIKRVAKALDRIDYRKHRDKFGDQFNYVHSSE